MGCASMREKIEYKMMSLKMQKIEILQEKNIRICQLNMLTGTQNIRPKIPDYYINENKIQRSHLRKKRIHNRKFSKQYSDEFSKRKLAQEFSTENSSRYDELSKLTKPM